MKAASVLALLVLLPAAQRADAEELGRLFHTPEQRKALDAARGRSPEAAKPVRAQPIPKREPPPLQGYLVRSDGVSTVWVEGRAVRVSAKEK